eukprot:CAMPEP_0185695064 /NCGR_PEP_ID=MMETSP1164-20130828/4287_1 /TAXON_ID=1104430 /ORGANISM="Chrysoreinhardia sp, Strain CCMP2950" /LENGTH=607 /DNA_ID=CAMNT_0028361921 /DNA_START=45 /DNA_END=1868 /DNA_ORIENTATION=-
MAKKKVVIVGAGPSGLVSLKEMLEAGHEAVLVEKSHVIGGVFSTLADSAYDSLYLTISNVFMAYSDFPPPESYIKYSKKEEYAQYLELYAAHFGLKDHIKFETTVEKATLQPDGTWTIALTSKKSGAATETLDAVDSLVVCTGSNQTPKKTPANIAKFGREIMHSVDFQNAADFKGKRALIVGVGESAADIASEISTVAARTTVWSRRPFLVAPRYIQIAMTTPGFDEFECMGDDKLWSACKVGDFLETGTTSRVANAAPQWLYASIRQMAWRLWANDPAMTPSLRVLGKHCKYTTRGENFFRGDQAGWVTKNSRLMQMLASGAVEIVIGKTADFSADAVTFTDVEAHDSTFFAENNRQTLTRDLDIVVCCTGYTNDFSWIDVSAKNDADGAALDWCPRTWYKHCWPPAFAEGNLAFIGWARPHQGGIPQTSELCARFHALLLSGDRALPKNVAALTKLEADTENDFYRLSPGLTSLVDWPSYAQALVRMIGCEPRTPWAIFQPATWVKYWVYPLWPCWFRLRGPGAKPAQFHAVMNRFPVIGSKVLVDPITLALAMPWGFAQKFIVNPALFPFKWLFSRTSFVAKSKINILHGNHLRIRDLFNWSV